MNQEQQELLQKAREAIDDAYERAQERNHRAQMDAFEDGCRHADDYIRKALELENDSGNE